MIEGTEKNIQFKMKIKETPNSKEAKVNVVAQEIRFAKLLSGNEANPSAKERQLRKLKKWLKNRASASFCKLYRMI